MLNAAAVVLLVELILVPDRNASVAAVAVLRRAGGAPAPRQAFIMLLQQPNNFLLSILLWKVPTPNQHRMEAVTEETIY